MYLARRDLLFSMRGRACGSSSGVCRSHQSEVFADDTEVGASFEAGNGALEDNADVGRVPAAFFAVEGLSSDNCRSVIGTRVDFCFSLPNISELFDSSGGIGASGKGPSFLYL